MSVYVDPLANCLMSKHWRWPQSCHLFADSVAELHAFAGRIGLLHSWFQHRAGKLPHYDLTARKRAEAVAAGAIEMAARDAVEFWRSKGWRPNPLAAAEPINESTSQPVNEPSGVPA